MVNLPNFIVLHPPLGNPQDYILARNENNNHPFPLEKWKILGHNNQLHEGNDSSGFVPIPNRSYFITDQHVQTTWVKFNTL